MSTFSLFDDWAGDGEITHSSSSKDKNATIISKTWKQWCLLTQREDVKKENPKFTKAVREAIALGCSEEDIFAIIDGAARTAPRSKDPEDLRRVTTSMTNMKTRKFALSALKDDLPIQFHPLHQEKMTIQEVASILETKRDDWGDGDIESAILITERYETEELIHLADQVALIVGQDSLFPSEIIRFSARVESGKYKVKKNDKRSSYNAGAVESEKNDDINFYADKAADVAFNRGVPSHIVTKFHNEAPKGYWDEVSVLRRASKTDLYDIYSSLQKRFQWHPDDREPIAKSKR